MKVVFDSDLKLMEEYTQILWMREIDYIYIPRANYNNFAEIYANDIYKKVIDAADEIVFIGRIGDFMSHGIGYKYISEAKELGIEINSYSKHVDCHSNSKVIFNILGWSKTGETFTTEDGDSMHYDKSTNKYILDTPYGDEISLKWNVSEYNEYGEPCVHIHYKGGIPADSDSQKKILDIICDAFSFNHYKYNREE